MILETLVVSMFGVNCYILGSEQSHEAAVIDPGGNINDIIETLKRHDLIIKYILATHCHPDHIGALKKLKDATGAEFLAHSAEEGVMKFMGPMTAMFGLKDKFFPKPDRSLSEGDMVSVGEIDLKVMHTPGHSPGGLCFHNNGFVFVGDTLFMGSIGRTDFPGCSYQDLIQSVKTKIFPLGDDVRVYPGHGPATTVGIEKTYNPFFQE
jgi:hydroxyacylglutathione hydrolase